jgi:hydrogenase maturation protein HypF
MARILACGAYLKNTACLFDTEFPDTPRWSAVHGDLSDPVACAALSQSAHALLAQAGSRVDAIAHDLHPDFFSTRLAQQLAQALGVPAVAVQHHHAHMAAVMAEHGLTRPVIGLALDGVGLGTDGVAWGGEVLWVHGESFERVGHLSPLALPGGDVAAREPWRMAAAALHALGLADQIELRLGPVVGAQAVRTIKAMLSRGVNSPPTTAAGRWFDAAAGLLGLSVRQDAEAQAAMALEHAAARHLAQHELAVNPAHWRVSDAGQIDLRALLLCMLADVDSGEPATVDAAAARFHLTLAAALAGYARDMAEKYGLHDVVLGGGCFFNKILKLAIVSQLEHVGLRVWCAQALSTGDAGLALGQAWVAAQHLQSGQVAKFKKEKVPCV